MNRRFAVQPACVLALVTVLVLPLGGCTPRTAGKQADGVDRLRPPPERKSDRPFRLSTPQIQQDIRDLMERVPAANPWEWSQLSRKLAAYGEPAVPQLMANLEASDESVQLISAFVLGVIKDPRSLDALHRSTLRGGEKVRFEAATSMLRMGDRRGLGTMIDGLEHPDPLIRARAILVLKERTGETLGYKADDRPPDRAAAVARWRAWHQRAGGVSRG